MWTRILRRPVPTTDHAPKSTHANRLPFSRVASWLFGEQIQHYFAHGLSSFCDPPFFTKRECSTAGLEYLRCGVNSNQKCQGEKQKSFHGVSLKKLRTRGNGRLISLIQKRCNVITHVDA